MAQSPKQPLIETTDLVKKFGAFTALNGVSLKVYPGEVHALLGDNGAGKSTLIKLLSGVFAPTSGTINVEGKTVSFVSPRNATDAGIGTVYQDLALNPLASVTRNFFLGRELTHFGGPFGLMKMNEMHRIAAEEMAKIGINIADPEQAVGTMSGGQRQTLAIARAIYFGAKVLILDEPTSALDPEMIAEVLDVIVDLAQDGMTMICVTHEMGFARRAADRMVFMDNGEIIETGSPSEFFDAPKTERCKTFLNQILQH